MMRGSPHPLPVADAKTYSHRGVITATPKDCVLGLMRCMRKMYPVRSLVRPPDEMAEDSEERRQYMPIHRGGAGGAWDRHRPDTCELD